MKILNYDQFCKMPAGTIFAPFKPTILTDRLAIKTDGGETVPEGHFLHQYDVHHTFNGVMPLEPWFDDYSALGPVGSQEKASFEIYDGDNNDYEKDGRFLVFEEEDIDLMISVLRWAKYGCVGEPNDYLYQN